MKFIENNNTQINCHRTNTHRSDLLHWVVCSMIYRTFLVTINQLNYWTYCTPYIVRVNFLLRLNKRNAFIINVWTSSLRTVGLMKKNMACVERLSRLQHLCWDSKIMERREKVIDRHVAPIHLENIFTLSSQWVFLLFSNDLCEMGNSSVGFIKVSTNVY